jgi:deleted-in-malignant-brain-tumors protein 1
MHLSAPTAQLNTYYGDGVYPIVWGAVRCRGWEASLSDCPRNDYLDFYCLRTDIAGVLCAEGITSCIGDYNYV